MFGMENCRWPTTLCLLACLGGCTETVGPLHGPEDTSDALGPVSAPSLEKRDVSASSAHHGTIVLNRGEGQPNGFCRFGPWTTTEMSANRRPTGGGTLSCSFSGLPAVPTAQRFRGFTCFLNFGGFSLTTETHFVRTPSGQGTMVCQFRDPIGP